MSPEASSGTARVAIIGAGFTGLTAAYRLSEAGVAVTVFEASADIGGLASGFTMLGQPVEKAYHFLYKTDEHILGLAEELGIRDTLTFHKSSVSTYYGDVLYPMMTPMDLLKFKPLRFHNRIRAGVTVLYAQKITNWQKLTTITALDWLRKYAGRQVTDVIWEPLLRGKFDRYYDKVTMSWLWGRVKQRVETRERGEAGERLGYFDGGFASLVDTLVSRCAANGVEFRMSQPVDAITHDEGTGENVVRVGGAEERFDRVLATVPSSVLARLIAADEDRDPAYFEQLRSIDYLDAAVHVFATDQEITPYYWHNINTPNSPFVVFLSLTALIGTERFGGKHVYYIGDYVPREHWYMSADEGELREHWYAQLQRIFPDFDRSRVVEDRLFRFRDAQHIVDIGYERKLPDHQTPCPGVLLCNFSQIYPMDRGTNYAVHDGNRMAARILEDLGRTAPAPTP
jgi:protoporphyrinogen oxidase